MEFDSLFDISISFVIIGLLLKSVYGLFKSYVWGVIKKLIISVEFKEYGYVMNVKMVDIIDDVIDEYEK